MRKFINIMEETGPDNAERIAAFNELARAQRGEPEIAMVRAQHALGGGVLSYCIEHVGDLTHRMAQYPGSPEYHCGFELVKPKVTRCLGMMQSGYISRRTGGSGFQEEHMENMRNNAEYYGMTVEEFLDKRVRPALKHYADEHRKLRVYNICQSWAKEAAIALGEERFDDAKFFLSAMAARLSTPEEWAEKASVYNPHYGEKRLAEAPITDISFHGSSEPASLRADDIGIVNSSKGRAKIVQTLRKAPIPIKLVFINHSHEYSAPDDGIDITGVGDPRRMFSGEVPASGEMTPAAIKRAFDVDIPADPKAFTAVFGFNEGDERRPLTPWMIAHRLGHLINERGRSVAGGVFTRSLRELNRRWRELDYDDKGLIDIQNILHEIGTFKSARDSSVRGLGEFVLECFAQFLITGRITFRKIGDTVTNKANAGTRANHPRLADMLDRDGNPSQRVPNPNRVNEVLDDWRDDMEDWWFDELEHLVGKIIVM